MIPRNKLRVIPGKTARAAGDRLRRRGLRITKARRAILALVAATEIHPTADWVFRQVRRDMPRVSLGTVYRNLRVLARAGLLVERPDPAGNRFDGNLAEHDHFTCVRCGGIYDVTQPANRAMLRRVKSPTGFAVFRYRVEFFGRCAGCGSSPNKEGRRWQERA
jgi:Fur family peroxide stress response transcriptional regulator